MEWWDNGSSLFADDSDEYLNQYENEADAH